MLSQFMLATSFTLPNSASYSPVGPTWFYLCHHIRLSGGKALLMTQRLLALCFGLPVNAGHADGISHSLHYQFTISIAFCCHPQGYQTTIKQTSAGSLSSNIPKDCRPTVAFQDGKQCFYSHGTLCVEKLTLWTNWLLSGFKTQLPVILSRRRHPHLHFTFLCNMLSATVLAVENPCGR